MEGIVENQLNKCDIAMIMQECVKDGPLTESTKDKPVAESGKDKSATESDKPMTEGAKDRPATKDSKDQKSASEPKNKRGNTREACLEQTNKKLNCCVDWMVGILTISVLCNFVLFLVIVCQTPGAWKCTKETIALNQTLVTCKSQLNATTRELETNRQVMATKEKECRPMYGHKIYAYTWNNMGPYAILDTAEKLSKYERYRIVSTSHPYLPEYATNVVFFDGRSFPIVDTHQRLPREKLFITTPSEAALWSLVVFAIGFLLCMGIFISFSKRTESPIITVHKQPMSGQHNQPRDWQKKTQGDWQKNTQKHQQQQQTQSQPQPSQSRKQFKPYFHPNKTRQQL